MRPPDIIHNLFNQSFYNNGNGAGGDSALPLPLNLIALIISFVCPFLSRNIPREIETKTKSLQLDEPSDLARVCRTCRVFHYMTLPQLYDTVSLRSYDYIRYSNKYGRPDGFGMASPFSMGLNGLATRNVAGYVRKFRMYGEWREYDVEECAKVGRVPDGSMLLNSLVRVVVEKMGVLDSFRYGLLEVGTQGGCSRPSAGNSIRRCYLQCGKVLLSPP